VRRFGKDSFRTPLRLLLVAAPTGVAGVAIAFATASLAAEPTIEAAGGSPYSWSPSGAQTAPGGTVTFRNPSGSVEHGVTWTSGPETPTCSNVPINAGKTSWTGTCSFTQAGNYGFYCPVHPGEMKGTITVTAAGSPPPTPPPPPVSSGGPAASGLQLAKRQRGGSVRGSIVVGDGGAKLVVELRGSRALLGTGRAGKMRVGHIVRGGVAGHVAFAVPLTRVARSVLAHERHALPLLATVTVTGQGDDVFKQTRRVVMLGSGLS
jgi:plastocyanin